MIISSPFKDYYDYVAHQYGGGDPKIVYPRIRLAERDKYGYMGIREVKLPDSLGIRNGSTKDKYEYKWLVITGKYYLLVRLYYYDNYMVHHETPWSVFAPGKIQEVDDRLISKRRNRISWMFEEPKTYEYYVGRSDPRLIEISREIQAPVFCLCPDGVEGDVPILGNLGIPSIISAEQIYQDLSYFMGNIINEVPDLQPAGKPPMTDKERILSHGFDMKASFRHRNKGG